MNMVNNTIMQDIHAFEMSSPIIFMKLNNKLNYLLVTVRHNSGTIKGIFVQGRRGTGPIPDSDGGSPLGIFKPVGNPGDGNKRMHRSKCKYTCNLDKKGTIYTCNCINNYHYTSIIRF